MSGPTIGSIIRAERLGHDLTLEALAQKSGLTDRAISDIERGVRAAPRLHTLRSLAEALALTADRREELFAAARTARASRLSEQPDGFLTRHLPDFVGRVDELAHLRALIDADLAAAPAVVITGPPGTGKTAFASEYLHQEAESAHRLYADLRGLDSEPVSPSGVLRQLLSQLPGAPAPSPSLSALAQQWRTATAGRTVLVLLDNAASEAQIRPVVGFEGTGAVVVTSRCRLAGLEGAKHLSLGPLSTEDSIQLLSTIVPEGAGTEGELSALADLCASVPLALRIAGSRLAANPTWRTEDFLQELRVNERRLRALAAGDLAVESAFALSYEHVSPESRQLFQALSLIDATTWSDLLAAAILDAPRAGIQAGLDELVELGLVEQLAPTRFRLHDLIRLFSRAKLLEAEPAEQIEALERRKREWLIRTSIAACSWIHRERAPNPGLVGFQHRAQAQQWLLVEVENWMASLRAAAALGEFRAVLDLAEALVDFADIWLHLGMWREVFTLSTAASEAIDDDRDRAFHFASLSWAEQQHDTAAALAAALRSLKYARGSGSPEVETRSRILLSQAYVHAGQYEEAISASEELAAYAEAMSDGPRTWDALTSAAIAKIALDRPDDAESDLRTVLAGANSRLAVLDESSSSWIDARLSEMIALILLSRVLREKTDFVAALRAAESAGEAAESVGSERGKGRALQLRGHALSLLGDTDVARNLLHEARSRFLAIASVDDVAVVDALLVELHLGSADES